MASISTSTTIKPAAQSAPTLPRDVFHEHGWTICQDLSPLEANELMSVNARLFSNRTKVHRLVATEKHSLSAEELQQYQGIFSLAMTGQRELKSWQQIHQWKDGEASAVVFRKLQEIPIHRDMTEEDLIALIEMSPNLRSISFEGLATDAVLHALAQNCPNLTSIDLSSCSEITDVGIQALAEHCPNLTSINLNYCNEIAFDGVNAIAENCTKLISISLERCQKIDDDALRVLAEGCPNLTSINVERCYDITDEGVIALTDEYPNLSIDYTSMQWA